MDPITTPFARASRCRFPVFLTLLAIVLTLPCNAFDISRLQAVANEVAARRAQRISVTSLPEYVVVPSPVPLAEPTNVHSTVTPEALERIPDVMKVDGVPVGLLRWTAAADRPGDPVVGYEVQRDSGHPINVIYSIPAPTTEFPFKVGDGGWINVVTGEFWKVRAVFKSGARSPWAISQTFPERIALPPPL